MSFDYRAARKEYQSVSFDFDALINAVKRNANITPVQPGHRQRKSSGNLAKASLLAPLLLAESCLSTGKRDLRLDENESNRDIDAENDLPLSSVAPGGSTSPVIGDPVSTTKGFAQDDGNFSTAPDTGIQIAASDLLANDLNTSDTALTLVRVFGASHGTVVLENGVITFTPDAGYEGLASFQYEGRNADGSLSTASVEVDVSHDHGGHDDHAGGHEGHEGHDDHAGGHDMGGDHAAGHMEALMLVPVNEATHVAVNNGSWFDPNTWASGTVPGEDAKVVIPEGVTVTYDDESPASIFTIRVDGSLDFATDTDTFLEVDTFVVTSSGHVTIGTVGNPVLDNVSTTIQFADNGPIDVSWDPTLLSRGLISHGAFEVHGAEKETFLKVSTDPMAGDTSLTLDELPEGWEVGDSLVLTGTHLTPYTENLAPGSERGITTEDEELVITSIVGNVIHFDKPLEFDHDTPRGDLKAYVANYSRNVQFVTENSDDVPVHQRGHVMLGMSDMIDVRYAEFNELGRTDKSERALDVDELSSVDSDTNIKARYPLHLHHAGVSDKDDPAMLVGNSVWGSPGWGYVHHDSNAILADNAAYDVFGAGFVAETGNEIGRWTHNISIKSEGVEGGAKWHEDVDAFDLGRTGSGFWFQGRLVDAVDNVAAGVPGGEGFVYMSRGNGVIDVLQENLHQPETLRYQDEGLINKPAISSFSGNESIATGSGLVVIKGGPEQGHDVRSVFEDFTAWETRFGVHIQYTGHYTFKDIDVVGTTQSAGASAAVAGFETGPNTFDITFNGVNIEGFEQGFNFSKTTINLNHPFDGNFEYIVIDPTFTDVTVEYTNKDSGDLVLSSSDLVEGRLVFDSNWAEFDLAPQNPAAGTIELSGTKTDSIGTTVVSPTWDPNTYDWFSLRGAVEQEGYWTLADGRIVTAFDQYYTDRATGEIEKVAIFVENPDTANLNDHGGFTRVDPVNHGLLDLNSAAPVGRDDFATVDKNGSVIIDVLANDYDPDGDPIAVDGLVHPGYGRISDNGDGTVTYTPDPNYSGTDEFSYWVEDNQGNFDKAVVQVTVDV